MALRPVYLPSVMSFDVVIPQVNPYVPKRKAPAHRCTEGCQGTERICTPPPKHEHEFYHTYSLDTGSVLLHGQLLQSILKAKEGPNVQ